MPVIYVRTTSNKEVANLSRVKRVIRLIQYLRDWKTINQCSNEIGIAERSVHRYLNLLVNLGFVIETKHGKRNNYRLSNLNAYFNLD
jgi:predicted DNA-binding transcriptional regulator YafY